MAKAAKPLYNSVPTIGKTVKIPWLKVGHIAGYSLLGASLLYGFGPGRRQSAVYALGVALLYALTDELHQTFVPGRSAGIMDVLIDVGAAGVVILLLLIINFLRQSRGN